LRILREAQRFLAKPPRSDDEQASRQFPQLLGSHLTLTDPLLEFVKACGAVFQLDAQANPRQGEQLLKLAYALLNVREFSDATAWVNPCLSWTLHDVICPACARCRDLDFCRDSVSSDLTCDACGHPYDLEALQSEMISLLRVDLEAYQRQDLACRSCAAVKADAMQQTCLRCATGFKTTTGYDAKTLRSRVRVAGRIAERFGLVALKLYVDALTL
jgi:DNA polymerase epsilon subunit 1